MGRHLLIALLGVLLCAVGCKREEAADGKPKVVVTTPMIGDLVRRIAGDRVNLTVIMPPGVDPHTYKPATSDLGNAGRADLVLYNGLHLEGKMMELFEGQLKNKAVAITRDIPQTQLRAWEEGGSGAYDPHVWFDISLWRMAATTVRDELLKLDATGGETYRANAAALDAELAQLEQEAKSKIASIPAERRVLITSHDAYNYFGHAYGIEVRGLQGISTETEAGLSNINSAVEFIISRKIPAIFVESSVSPKTIERVQADCKARGFNVQIGGELYSDSMGTPGERPGYAVETYVGMFRYNVDTIVKALGGTAQ